MPQTRHYEMKDSGVDWIGKMPSHWSASPFKKIIAQNDGGVWGEDPIDNDGAVVLRSTEQTVDGKWNIEQPAKRDLSHVAKLRYYKLEIGDLLITKSSGSALHIGKTSIVDADIAKLHCYYSNFMQRVRLKQNVMPKLYWYILNSSIVRYQFVFLQNSTSGIGNINSKHIDNIIVPVPPLSEQTAIAAYLDKKCATIDAIIAEAKASIEEYKSWKASVIFETVTKGLNPNAEMKDSGVEWIGEMPKKWDKGRIKYNYYLKGRIGWQGLKADEFIDDGPYYLITGTDFENGRIAWKRCYRINEARFQEAPEIHVKIGDLLITKDGTVGKVAYINYIPEKASLNSHLLIIRPLVEDYSNKYLFWVIQSSVFEKYCGLSQNGSIMASLSQEKMSGFSFPLPSLAEQLAIASFLEEKCAAIDSVIAEKEALISDLETYKRSLIFEVVTGKRRVC